MSTLEIIKGEPELKGDEVHAARPKAGGWLAFMRDKVPHGMWMQVAPVYSPTHNWTANPGPLHPTREAAIQSAQNCGVIPPEGRVVKLFKLELE